jgi:hypothetical protein
MPSIRGSSQFKAIKGITVYGITGNTGPQGPQGTGITGATGATASVYLTNVSLAGYTLVSTFLDGSTYGASGAVYGVTGNTVVYLDGLRSSGGTAYVFVGATATQQTIEIRKIKGSTGFRSYVGITSDSQTVTINVERYDGEYSLANGSLTEIIKYSNSVLNGTTAAKYGQDLDQVKIIKANVYEKTRGAYTNSGSLDWSYSFDATTLNLHPNTIADNTTDRRSKAKIYAIDLNSLNSANITKIVIDKPSKNPIGFSLYVQGGVMTESYNTPIFSCPEGSGGSVIFPFNKQPCFRTGEKFLIHFISSGDVWYGYIYGNAGGSGEYFCTDSENLKSFAAKNYYFYQGLTGACCKSNGTCEITTQGLCDGFFSGIETTCGTIGTDSVCSENLGSCCVKNTVDGKVTTYCIENISALDCLALNNDSVQTVFSGFLKTCRELDCNNCFEELGGCCDGKGNCTQETELDCYKNGGSFLGKGVLCNIDEKTPTCSSGTGACCTPAGVCTVTTANLCFTNGGNYFGNGTTCAGITCTNTLRCGSYLNFKPRPGDLLGGGIIIGIFNPKASKLLGAAHAFSRTGITAEFMFGGETLSQYYQSEYDYSGYGITGDTCVSIDDSSDSYYIVASLYPVSVDKNNELVDPTSEAYEKQTFIWYGTGSAWGPLTNLTTYSYGDFTYLDKTYEKYYLAYGEGYYGLTGDTLDNIKTNTFQSCYSSRSNGLDPIARLFTRTPKGANGLWNRNWGLYNTIRMIAGDNADYLKLSNYPYFDSNTFESGTELTAVRALKLFDNSNYTNSYGLTGNPQQLTDWYIPSHDELAFVAANCVTDSPYGININSELLVNGGVPFDGWHWSSTGSFDTGITGEGVYTSGKPTHGSVAWAMYFDTNGEQSNFLVKKETRDSELKVRPIRAIRCDGLIPNSSTEQYKLWKTPNLLRNRT